MSDVLVLGASSLVGHWLLPRLDCSGFRVHAVGRHATPANLAGSTIWHGCNVTDMPRMKAILPACEAVVSLLPLWLLPPTIPILAARGCHQLIAFGSTSALSKVDSADPQERELAERLTTAERAAADAADQNDIALKLLRPTMIYDGVRDKNVKRLRDLLRRYRCFPLFGGGIGLRQPVHADDLAAAAVAALTRPASTNVCAIYNLSGGEILPYRDMILRIAAADGIRPLLIEVPTGLIPPVVALAKRLPRFRELNTAMLTRMNRDLIFDHTAATRDLGFSPRPFTLD